MSSQNTSAILTVPMSEVRTESNKLTELVGRDKMRTIAAIGLAAAGLLGVSGKPESGVGVGVEIPNPTTGEQVSVGIVAASTEGEYAMGLPAALANKMRDIQSYQLSIGGVKLAVYTASLWNDDGSMVKTVGVYPGFQSKLGKK